MGEEICQDIQQKLRATSQVYLPDIDTPLSITKGLFNMLDTKRKQLAKARKVPEVQYDFEDLLFQLVIEDPPEEEPVERQRERKRLLNDLLPMLPTEGPPLPRGWGIKWPWKGEDVAKKLAERLTKRLKDRGEV